MKIVIFLGIFLFLILGINQIYAVPISYDETELNLTWNSVGTNPLVFDTDADGIADNFYTWSVASRIVTVTKVLGDGLTTTNNQIKLSGGTQLQTNVVKDMVFFGSMNVTSVTCNFYISSLNITSNIVVNNTMSFNVGINDVPTSASKLIGGLASTGEPSYLSECRTGTNTWSELQSGNATHTWHNTGSFSATSNSYSPSHVSHDGVTARMITFDKQLYTTTTTKTLGNINYPYMSAFASNYLNLLGTSGASLSLSGNITPIASVTIPTASVSSTVQMSFMGMASNTGKSPTSNLLRYDDLIYSFDSSSSRALMMSFLPYKLLDPTLTTDVPKFAFTNGGNNYVAYVSGALVKYALLPDVSERSFGFLLLDDSPTTLTNPITTDLVFNSTYTLNTPSTTYTGFFNKGLLTLISGYNLVPESTINRQFDVRSTNTTEILPSLIGDTVSQSSLSLIVKNSPSSSGIKITDTIQKFDGTYYNWSIGRLLADKSYTVDLDASKCVFVWIRDISFADDTWVNTGELCNSGSMPKTITFTSNLSFTFWSLPYGVTHTFTQSTENLNTKVRHDTTPFNYTVQIYDSSNVLSYETEFASSSEIDVQNINASGIDRPAIVRVFDDNGNQLYYASIGTPSYLSGDLTWFNEWLTVEGFNLIFLLPIIFSAMFTRNTVGIGTTITVIFIASLTWFGVLPIPDLVIYFMIGIAIIGQIAYKKLYD